MLQLLTESLEDYVILILDPDGVVLTWSPAGERIKGYKTEEIIGHSFEVFYTAEDRQSGKAGKMLQQARNDGQAKDEGWRVRKDGTRFWASVVITALRSNSGDLIGFGKVTRDITERRTMEEERDRFFALSLDLLCIANADGFFRRVSQAFTDTLGWTPEELLARPFMEFVHPDDLEATTFAIANQFETGESVIAFENRFQHRDGSWRILSWKSIPQSGGMMYSTARDVTKQKAREAQIAELNASLVARAAELEKARLESDRANAAKSLFLSHMSHELRTPLNAVIGNAQLLQLHSSDPDVLECAESILRGGRHLLDLINEVLDLARIEAGKLALSLEAVAISAAVEQATQLTKPFAAQHGVSILIVDEPCRHMHVRADRQRLVQVLLNLLSNGAKYNRPGGSVTIRCSEQPGGIHRIEVSDTGRGMDERAISGLFVPFERGNQIEEGTGLGLALSHQLMELMGGHLSLVKTDEDGTTFAVNLPKSDPPSITSGDLARDVPRNVPEISRRLQIVCIEDNISNVQLMERIFRDVKGVELLPAIQGRLGLQLVEDHSPDLVLLDLHLPDMHGIEVLKKLKANPVTASIPVVVLSADATDNQIKRLLEAGAKTYLTKPIDLALLFAELDEVKLHFPRS